MAFRYRLQRVKAWFTRKEPPSGPGPGGGPFNESYEQARNTAEAQRFGNGSGFGL